MNAKEKKAHADAVESMADRKRDGKAKAKGKKAGSGAADKGTGSTGKGKLPDDPTDDLVSGANKLLKDKEAGNSGKDKGTATPQSISGDAQSKPHGHDASTGRRQCSAKSKRSGERCKKSPLKGQHVCEFHGGKTPEALAAGERRENKRKALEQADRLVQLDGVDMDPIDHLLDSLHRASQLVVVYGIMCAEVDNNAEESLSDDQIRGELGYEIVEEEVGEGKIIERFVVEAKDRLMALNKHQEAQLHPYLQAYSEALRDRAKFAKMCIDAGIAKMQMELVERQVDMAQEALEQTLAEMKLDKKKRQEFVRSYARNLRDIGCAGSSAGALVRSRR